jgi:hypothetical protein
MDETSIKIRKKDFAIFVIILGWALFALFVMLCVWTKGFVLGVIIGTALVLVGGGAIIMAVMCISISAYEAITKERVEWWHML